MQTLSWLYESIIKYYNISNITYFNRCFINYVQKMYNTKKLGKIIKFIFRKKWIS